LDRLQEFLDSQHHIKDFRKKGYRKAVKAFERNCEGKPFDSVYLDSAVVHKVLSALENQVEDSTWNEMLCSYKRLSKWLSDPDDEEYPKLWRKIERKHIDWEEKLKNKWLSEEEFLRIIDFIDSPRDRAMFCVAVSGALRACELMGLKIGNVEVQGFEVRVTVSGKTGTRSFVMNQFAPVVKHWLNFHPYKHDKDAPLWVRRKENPHVSMQDGLRPRMADRLLKAYAKRAGITKPVSLHWLKHTKITWTARNRKVRISDKQANALFGWSPNSTMYRRYAHLHGTDTDDTFRALEGVETVEDKAAVSKVLERRRCLNCNEWNGADALYCLKCGNPLDEEAAQRLIDLQRMQNELLRFQPELLRLLREKAEKEAQEKGKK
jgi:integrase